MANRPVINTSPLIFLTQASQLDLLQTISTEFIVPQAVASEIQAYGNTDPTTIALAETDWLIVTQNFRTIASFGNVFVRSRYRSRPHLSRRVAHNY